MTTKAPRKPANRPPKAIKGWPPTHLSFPHPARSRGQSAIGFIESFCRVTKDTIGGKRGDLIVLRPWQKKLIIALLATEGGSLRHRQALIGMPRKNGKSALLAGLVLWQLVCGPAGGEIYSIAGDRQQAGIVFDAVKAMIGMEPELAALLRVQRDVIVNDSTGTIYRKLSSDAKLGEGYNPTFVVADEVHVLQREGWDVMALGSGARPEALMVGISTAGVRTDRFGGDSLCFSLYNHGKRVASGEEDDPTFFFCWWEANPEDAHDDPITWGKANPGFGDLVAEDDFASVIRRTPENEFRTKRLNQWVAVSQAWLPTGAWAACRTDRSLIPGKDRVVFGFDGSRTNDSTALVIASIEEHPHIEVLELWERPHDDEHWRVRSDDVLPVIRELAELWDPEEIVADPAFWRDDLEDLADEGLPIVEFDQRGLMDQAAQSFYEATVNQRVSHDGDPRLSRHLDNAVARITPRGVRLSKESKNSGRKIDLAVAAVMAHNRASLLANTVDEEFVILTGIMTPQRLEEIRQEREMQARNILAPRRSEPQLQQEVQAVTNRPPSPYKVTVHKY